MSSCLLNFFTYKLFVQKLYIIHMYKKDLELNRLNQITVKHNQPTNQPTNQTNKQTNKQTNNQTNKQTTNQSKPSIKGFGIK